jgi:hypothetical protein|tara:strand:+ start:308 stop:598 length:291 start_codon:yes stop_codon:yes gene_type:complete
LITLAIGHGASLLAEKTDLSVAEQLAQLRQENKEMRAVLDDYRQKVLTAGGPRVQEKDEQNQPQETSFAEVDESTDDPTIQCQTICKFVRPAAGGN